MFGIAINHVTYHVISAILGFVLLYETIRAIYIYIRIANHPHKKIEWILKNIKIANIALLLLLAIREFAEAFIFNRTGIDYWLLTVLRIVPPIIYIYLQRIVATLLVNNEAFGIQDYKHDFISHIINLIRRRK